MGSALLFDLDETLVDRSSSAGDFLASQCRRFQGRMSHVTPDRYCRAFMDLNARGFSERRTLYEALVRELGLGIPYEELLADYRENSSTSCRLFIDTRDVLRTLRERGHRLGIVTNGSAQLQGAKIHRLGLETLVDTVLISESEGIRKPEREIFRRAADRLGTVPTDCVFVGDNPVADISGAVTAGMTAVWVCRGSSWPEELSHQPTHTITTLLELLGLDFPEPGTGSQPRKPSEDIDEA